MTIMRDFSHSRPATTPAIAKWLYLSLGLGFVALGFIGAFLPVLPTTPFLILAAACFARSSRRLEAWLLSHPKLGPLLQSWRERGAIPLGAKLTALAGCVVGFGLFLWNAAPPWPLSVLILAVMLVGIAYVFTRPDS